ncbi:MAG TPA: hypothetical protein VJN42_03200, partial [Candidatus Acidoferrum sp.]|nr:hypothetical protein [Candidatus Acidoferrum sp.]
MPKGFFLYNLSGDSLFLAPGVIVMPPRSALQPAPATDSSRLTTRFLQVFSFHTLARALATCRTLSSILSESSP